MTREQIILFSLFALVFAALISGRWRYDAVAFAALLAAVLLGVVPAATAFDGFGHPATLVVALVLVVSAGLTRAGAVLMLTRRFIRPGRPLGAHVAMMGAIGGLMSAFMNNVAALAILMPVDVSTARQEGRAPGWTLMPLSFATILGGMITLIGTPPNIIVATIRGDALGAPFAMFDFAPVGGIVALAGLLFVAFAGWRLIPLREERDARPDVAAFVAELVVSDAASIAGQPLSRLQDEADRVGATLVAIVRDGRARTAMPADFQLRAGDVLRLEAGSEALDSLRAGLKLDFADSRRKHYLEAERAGLVLVQAAVPAGARIVGKSAESVGLIWRHGTALMGLSRQGRAVTGPLRKAAVRAGDVVLLLAPADRAGQVLDWLGCLPMAEGNRATTRPEHTFAAIAIFALAVIAASVGLVDLPVALGCVVAGYVGYRILPLAEVYDHVEWPVIVLLGSMIPLGAALESSGGTTLIAAALLDLSAGAPAWVAVGLLMVVTMTLSDVLNNTATAIVAAPVGIAMADALGASPDPFLMAVAVAASCAFLTPIGHKNNMLILSAGEYRFGDYWRMGLPLEVLVVAAGLPAILFFWPL
jgi:di/tricarboxylate transporter